MIRRKRVDEGVAIIVRSHDATVRSPRIDVLNVPAALKASERASARERSNATQAKAAREKDMLAHALKLAAGYKKTKQNKRSRTR